MITKSNLDGLYEIVITDIKLTTKELNIIGFNSKYINDLIKNGVIERVKRGYYKFLDVDSLFLYGKKLISSKEYEKAIICFEKCYKLDKNHKGVSFQLFFECVQNGEYEKALIYFDCLYNSINDFYNRDNDFYLYLLSMITKLPEKYIKYARYIRYEDVRVDNMDERYTNKDLQNKVRLFSLNQKFLLAQKQLNEENNSGIQSMVIKALLKAAIQVQFNEKNEMIKLATSRKYDDLIDYIENIEKKHELSMACEYILVLAKELKHIELTNEIPVRKNNSTDSLFKAIDEKNFELALELSKNYLKIKKIPPKTNPIYILLEQILELIKTKTNKNENELKEEDKKLRDNFNDFSNIVIYLTQKDMDKAFKALSNYLKFINKKDYEFLIIDLIKISLLEKDEAFVKPIIVLSHLTKENFTFDLFTYIQNFYLTLVQNKFNEARLYLDIIKQADKLGQTCIFTDSLLQVLEETEKKYNRDEDNINSLQNVSENEDTKEEYLENTSYNDLNASSELSILNDFVKTKMAELYQNGIVILEPMSEEKSQKIYKIVENLLDVSAFSIGPQNQVVLKYTPTTKGYIPIKSILNEANTAYNEKDYDKFISLYREILETKEPKIFIYARLGFAYLKKHNINIAIDYLTVATELSKKENDIFDYSDLIFELKEQMDRMDKKPFKMNANDFAVDLDNYYNLDIYKIADLINMGMDIKEACLNLGLNDEQQSLAALLIARESYAKEEYEIGDYYLKYVEKTKNKSKFIISLFQEISKNKKFYKNRLYDNHKSFTLTRKK